MTALAHSLALSRASSSVSKSQDPNCRGAGLLEPGKRLINT
jgi:hypothetical protein